MEIGADFEKEASYSDKTLAKIASWFTADDRMPQREGYI